MHSETLKFVDVNLLGEHTHTHTCTPQKDTETIPSCCSGWCVKHFSTRMCNSHNTEDMAFRSVAQSTLKCGFLQRQAEHTLEVA